MINSEVRKYTSQIRKQQKLIKQLKDMVRRYAPYMEFPDEIIN